eukprot:2723884-Amphidinium_carterae.1
MLTPTQSEEKASATAYIKLRVLGSQEPLLCDICKVTLAARFVGGGICCQSSLLVSIVGQHRLMIVRHGGGSSGAKK